MFQDEVTALQNVDRESTRIRDSRRPSTDTSIDARSITSQSDTRSYRERLKDRINVVKVREGMLRTRLPDVPCGPSHILLSMKCRKLFFSSMLDEKMFHTHVAVHRRVIVLWHWCWCNDDEAPCTASSERIWPEDVTSCWRRHMFGVILMHSQKVVFTVIYRQWLLRQCEVVSVEYG